LEVNEMSNWKEFIVNADNDCFELGLIWSKDDSLRQIAVEIAKLIENEDYDYLACIEAKGIIYASAVSAVCGKELRIFRKLNKISYTDQKYVKTFLNWKKVKDGIEIEKEQIKNNDRIIIIDDIVDTGITLKSVSSIINEAGGKIEKYICIKNVSSLHELNGVPIVSLL
jgi:adenine phosphoribosyltransferase